MKRSITYSFFILLVLTVFLAASPVASAIAAETAETDFSGFSVMSGVSVIQTGDTEIMVEVKGNSLPAPEIIKEGTTKLLLSWPRSYVPSLNWQKTYHFPLVNSVTLEQNGEVLEMIISVNEAMTVKELQGTSPANRYRISLQTMRARTEDELQHAPKIKSVAPVRSNDPFARNVPVNMDLRDVELRDVFRMFSDIVGMNIIADPSVPAAYVTMTLKDVPLREAFGYLMKMYDVTYAIMGRTIIVGKASSLGKTLGKEKTRSYHIAYAEPQAVAGLLQGLAGIDQIVVDERMRTIYVTARDEQFIKVSEVLERVDNPGRQVMLQARIIEVSDGGQKDLQNSISAIYKKWQFAYASGGATAIDYNYSNIVDSALKTLDARIDYLESKNEGRVLASPSIVTLDGEEAEVKLIRKLKYQSGVDDNGNPVFDDEEVGPTLIFTPTVGRDNFVTIELEIETGDIIGFRQSGQSEVPETTERNAETTVRVREGEPFVIGGLFQENDSSSVTQVPILSQIPLIGSLFKSTTSNTDRSEVVMIVIPHILETPNGKIEEGQL